MDEKERQEDKELIIRILDLPTKESDGIKWVRDRIRERWVPLINFEIDDSFTGALVKAVFPLLVERSWVIIPTQNGIQIWDFGKFGDQGIFLFEVSNLNTTLIEAYKKIEGK